MRRPCPLYLDLISLILESDAANQRWLHFPWFRTASTRAVRAKRTGELAHPGLDRARAGAADRTTCLLWGADDPAGLRADAAANRPARAPSDSAQMVLFPAEVSGEVELGGAFQHVATEAA